MEGLEVHHIVPIETDASLAFDDNNLITLCGRCHEFAEAGQIKADDLRRMTARRPTIGYPPYPG